MIDVFLFLIDCVFGIFASLDNIVLFSNITLLKLLIILALFTTIVGFLYKKRG